MTEKMEEIEFWKMSGSGNDFIIIDSRNEIVPDDEKSALVERVCRRRESVGADGVIFVVGSDRYDFGWRFFNADGGEVEMCGNGGRCVARFAYLKGIADKDMTFETKVGPVSAEVRGRVVKVLMPEPGDFVKDVSFELDCRENWKSVDFINTGVPHVVASVENLQKHPVVTEGKSVRYHSFFSPEGTNVNFIKVSGLDQLEVRTYERGVEDETLACGTGAIASALVSSARGQVASPVRVRTRGGEDLKIYFRKNGDSFDQVYLEGNTSVIYRAQLGEEALQ
jgi:diaminopimelate epimerase